jgi:hypothetical protein
MTRKCCGDPRLRVKSLKRVAGKGGTTRSSRLAPCRANRAVFLPLLTRPRERWTTTRPWVVPNTSASNSPVVSSYRASIRNRLRLFGLVISALMARESPACSC